MGEKRAAVTKVMVANATGVAVQWSDVELC